MNSELIKLIASRMDDSVLEVASKSRLWEVIRPLLEDQSFWYRRTQSIINFEIEWNPRENWHQVYNILASLEDGSNPFSESTVEPTVLELNGYNLTAVKLLLRLKYDPSIEHSQSLVAATTFGSPEVIQLLLNDSRIDPLDNKRDVDAATFSLAVAAEQGRIDKMKILLGDSRVRGSREIIQSALYAASRNNQLEAMKFLMLEPLIDKEMLNRSLVIASHKGSLDIIRLLLQDSRVDPNTKNGEALTRAIFLEHIEAVKLLLQDQRLIVQSGQDGHLNQAIDSDNADIVRLLLEDPRATEDIDHVLTEAIQSRSVNVVKMLLLEYDINITRDLLLSATNEGVGAPILSLLLSDPRTDFSLLKSEDMTHLIAHSWSIISGSTERSASLSGGIHSRNDILNLINEACNSFTKCYYSMLLRELILKRLDLEYYLRWILKQLKKEDTSSEVRRLFSTTARSLSEDSPVHTSLFFTTYRGFFLLTVSDDSEVIMNTLRSEDRVTQEGINLAGMLIGAYLGGR